MVPLENWIIAQFISGLETDLIKGAGAGMARTRSVFGNPGVFDAGRRPARARGILVFLEWDVADWAAFWDIIFAPDGVLGIIYAPSAVSSVGRASDF